MSGDGQQAGMTAAEVVQDLHAPPRGTQWVRTVHLAEKGGCGADISASCFAFRQVLPMLTDRGLVDRVTIVRITPQLCPGCGRPIYFEPIPSPVQVARSIPGV